MYYEFKMGGRVVHLNVNLVYRPWHYRHRRPGKFLGMRLPDIRLTDFIGVRRVPWLANNGCTDLILKLWPVRVTMMVDGFGAGKLVEASDYSKMINRRMDDAEA